MLTLSHIGFWLVTVLGAGVGAFGGAYLKERAKNLATKKDFDDLKEQTRQLTTATKAIEAQISDQFWNKRRLWEMKRDALLSAVGSLGRTDDALMVLATAYDTAEKNTPEEWRDLKLDASLTYQKEANNFDEKRFEASLVCGNDLDDALRAASKLIRGAASNVFKTKVNGYADVAIPIQKAINEVLKLSRKELGINGNDLATSQSSGSSAAPVPD